MACGAILRENHPARFNGDGVGRDRTFFRRSTGGAGCDEEQQHNTARNELAFIHNRSFINFQFQLSNHLSWPKALLTSLTGSLQVLFRHT